MWDFNFSTAFGLMRKTAPFLIFRIAVYFGIAMAYVLVTGTGAGIGYGVGGFGDEDFRVSATAWGGAIGLGATAGVIYLMREYLLYVVKAGHIAVMVEALDGRELPKGKGQISYAKTIITDRFGEASVLFAVDQLIKGVIKAITGLVQGLLSILPIPGLDKIMAIVRAYLRLAVGLIDEVILAHGIRTRSENPYASAKEALVLYGQNAKPMMKNAAWLTLFTWGLSIIVFLIMLAPAAAIVYVMPGAWSAGGMVFALLFAWAVKVAVIEPFAIACLLQAFFKVTDGQAPNPEWEAKIDNASAKFQALGEKAKTWVTGGAEAKM
ncbi:hypothetical protein SAMN05444287_2155 [Octadecabacter temperatus]|uniref:Uncharacterized protein n=1 Tax=Octadecabacter temperatus TaxID=1458307 RepID=A0A0K0Y7Z0_9RHOB|nr:hypothetical protein [Octadecabacter temperatus]AKS47030.1 hypothetical protein OSB_24950 [Octadecabacter temperatus]SIO25498.1 hypothetical protein SAMN05444287_2155 [Octadecabacter temperatus]